VSATHGFLIVNFSVDGFVVSTRKPMALWFHFLTPVTCSISVPMFDNQCSSVLHIVDSFSLSVLFFPCTNTAVWHPIICYFGVELNFQLFCVAVLLWHFP
jgi:hypothetical protein